MSARCQHCHQDTAGSNQHATRVTCRDCGGVLFLYYHNRARKDLVQKALADIYWYLNRRESQRPSTSEPEPEDEHAEAKATTSSASASTPRTATMTSGSAQLSEPQESFLTPEPKDQKGKDQRAEQREKLVYRAGQLGLPPDQLQASNEDLKMILTTLETEEGRGGPRRRRAEEAQQPPSSRQSPEPC